MPTVSFPIHFETQEDMVAVGQTDSKFLRLYNRPGIAQSLVNILMLTYRKRFFFPKSASQALRYKSRCTTGHVELDGEIYEVRIRKVSKEGDRQ